MDIEEIKRKLKTTLDRSRFNHCLLVQKTAIRLATLHGASKEKAAAAGLLHDCAKWMSKKQLISHAKKFKIKTDDFLLKVQPKLLHSSVSAAIARSIYKVKDKQILQAIAGHTSGKENMSKLEKIIYIADHIEPNRKYKNADKARKIAESNMDKAIVLIATEMIEFLLKKSLPIHLQTIKTRNFYLKNG